MARAYTLVGEEIAKRKFTGQSALIIGEMSETEARTTSQITLKIKDRLITRQDPERVVAFYMGVWKKSGLVRLSEVAASDEPTTVKQVPAPAEHPQPTPEPGGITEPTPIEVPMTDTEPVPVGESEVGEETPSPAIEFFTTNVNVDDEPGAGRAANEEPEEQKFLPDLAGMKLSAAVEEVLKFKGNALNTEDVTKVLNDHGYEFKENQVASALQNLLKRETVTKIEGGFYQLAS